MLLMPGCLFICVCVCVRFQNLFSLCVCVLLILKLAKVKPSWVLGETQQSL